MTPEDKMSNDKYVCYEHHGEDVMVRKDLKGRHREHCLCFSCDQFEPDDREVNCKIANLLFSVCQLSGMVIPVWECGGFWPAEGKGTVEDGP